MSELYFVTSNKGKMKEAQVILNVPITIVQLELDELQELDLGKIVKHKVQQAYDVLHKPVFVDDVGLFADAWNGFPGPFYKFIEKSGGAQLFLKMLGLEKNRHIIARACIGFHDGTTIHTFIGEMKGIASYEERGTDGWGFDTIFIPEGYDKTCAELGTEIKNQLSHRKHALEKFKTHLTSLRQPNI